MKKYESLHYKHEELFNSNKATTEENPKIGYFLCFPLLSVADSGKNCKENLFF